MKKILGTVLALSMMSSMVVMPVSAAEFTVTAVTPEDDARLVSVIDDVVITFSEDVDQATLADGIAVSGGEETYQLKKAKNKVTILFDKQLSYLTEYTVTLDEDLKDVNGNALTPYEFSFKTEYNPVTTLYYDDFEDGNAAALAKFTKGGNPITEADGIYEVIEDTANADNHVLQMNPVSYSGYYPVFKGSNTWKWYTIDVDLKFGTPSRLKWLIKGAGDGLLNTNYRRYVVTVKAVNNKTVNANMMREEKNFTNVGLTTFTGHPGNSFPAKFEFTGDVGATKMKMTLKGNSNEDQVLEGSAFYMTGDNQSTGLFNFKAGSEDGPVTVDNMVVTDTGWYPIGYEGSTFVEEIERKNIEDTIKLYFYGSMTDVASDTITVTDKEGNPVGFTKTVSTTSPAYIDIALDNPEPYTEYIVTIPQGAVKRANVNESTASQLSNDKVISFKTKYVDFGVKSTTPANNAEAVEIDSDITLEFTDAVDFDTLTDKTIIIENAPAFTVSKVDDKTAKLLFDDELDFGTTYTVTLTDSILSKNGVAIEAKTFSFATMASDFNVVSSYPADKSRDISVLDDMTVEFKYDVDESTIENNITVTPEVEYDVKVEDKTVKLVFADALEYYTDYTVAFAEGIKSTNGMPLTAKTITFKTVPDMGNTLFYENFDGDAAAAQARFTEIGSENRHTSENFHVSNGVLNIPSWYNAGTNQGEKTIPMITGSDVYGDFELDFDAKIPDLRDIATSLGSTLTVDLRYGMYNTAISSIKLKMGNITAVPVGDNSGHTNNEFIAASLCRDNINAIPYFTTSTININDAETTPQWMNSRIKFKGIKGTADIDFNLSGYGQEISASYDSATSSNKDKEAYVNGTGAIAFSTIANTRTTQLDNILVKDLGFGVTADSIKNTNGSVSLKFTETINPETVAENVKVYDGENEVNAVVAGYDNVISVKVNNPESGKVYRVKISEGLKTMNGKSFPNERYIDFSCKLDLTIVNLNVMSGTEVVEALTGGQKIYGTCDVENIGAYSQEVTLVLAVYDENGALKSVKTDYVNLLKNTADTLKTAEITLPETVTDYSAAVFCWDNLININPLTDSVTVGK